METFVVKRSAVTVVSASVSLRPVDEIAKRLEQLRVERGWSGREFSLRADLSPKQFTKVMERGGAGATSETMAKFARAANVNVHWLLTGEGSRDEVVAGDVDQPIYGNAPGWSEAERIARAENQDVPGWSFEKSRRHRGLTPPNPVTPEFVLEQALLAWKWTPDVEKIERERKRIESRAQAMRTQHENKLKKQRGTTPANDRPTGSKGKRGK